MTHGENAGSRREEIARGVVGRRRELDLVLAAVAAGRDILLEGPPGTSKSSLLRAIAANWGVPFVLVEGNAELTPARLVGHHNPARVLREDYSAENFVDGPLVSAMRSGGFLYIEELNRAPEDTLNVLLAAMAEREVAVPRRRRASSRSGRAARTAPSSPTRWRSPGPPGCIRTCGGVPRCAARSTWSRSPRSWRRSAATTATTPGGCSTPRYSRSPRGSVWTTRRRRPRNR